MIYALISASKLRKKYTWLFEIVGSGYIFLQDASTLNAMCNICTWKENL
jgi:hypothetical protein